MDEPNAPNDDWIGWLTIAGGVVCCLVVLTAIVVGIVLLVRRTRKR